MDPGSIHARLVAASIWSALVAGMLYTSVTGEAATVQYLKALVAKEAVDCGPHHRLPIVVAAARFLLTSSQLRVKLLEPGAPDPTCALASCDVQCPVSAPAAWACVPVGTTAPACGAARSATVCGAGSRPYSGPILATRAHAGMQWQPIACRPRPCPHLSQ